MAADLQIESSSPKAQPHQAEVLTAGVLEQANSNVKGSEVSALKKSWYFVSLVLLGLYLTYFYLLNGSNVDEVRFLGAGFSVAWLAVCFAGQSCFRNRFEFAIHTLLTLDFVLESLVDSHAGFGFYFCASGFWGVFWFYHHLPLLGKRSAG